MKRKFKGFPAHVSLLLKQKVLLNTYKGLKTSENYFHISRSKKLKIDPAGSYLITGGLGGLGLKVAEWLAKQGAKHLVLAGRRASQKIEIPNATVETAALDISQKPDS